MQNNPIKRKKMAENKITSENLKEMPFTSVKELKTAQKNLKLKAFERIELAKAIYSLSKREDYEFWNKEFEAGFKCKWEDETLIRVYKNIEEEGITVSLYDPFKQLSDDALRVTMSSGNIVKALAESFARTYYLVNGFLPLPTLAPTDRDNKET